MKRFIQFATLTLITILALLYIPNKAEAATSGFYEYEVLTDGTVMITKYNGYEEVLRIPASIDGKTVTSLGPKSFENTIGTTNVVIPKEITSISGNVFMWSERLTTITVESGNPAYFSVDGILYSHDLRQIICYPTDKYGSSYQMPESITVIEGAFAGNNNLETILLSKNLSVIGENSFNRCAKLISLSVPEGVQVIKDSAFSNCYQLTNVYIASTVTSITPNAFENCNSLTYIQVAYGNQNYTSENGVLYNASKSTLLRCPPANEMLTYSIPDTVTTIGEGAFVNCKIKQINIGSKVSHIADGAFYNATKLETILVYGDNLDYYTIDGVLFNRDVTKLICYPKGKSVSYYYIPDTVNIIGDYAFYNCSYLLNVFIPASVNTIGHYSFRYCHSLATVTVPYTVSEINKDAFANCNNIKIRCVDNSAAFHYAVENSKAYEVYADTTMPEYKLSATELTLYTASPMQTLTLSNLLGKDVTWSSSDEKVVTVIEGLLTPHVKGTATITASYRGFRFTCKVTVKQSEINRTKISIKVGKTYTLNITGSDKNVQWKSSNTSVAKINTRGIVTAKKAGKVTITAFVNNEIYICEVTIRK